jgi:hypothetical protein
MKPPVYLTSSAVTLLFALAAALVAGCSTDAGGDPPRWLFPCDDPGPITIAGKDTGYAFCTGGPVYRAKAQACPSGLPRREPSMCQPSDVPNTCTEDAQCNDAPNGFCFSAPVSNTCFCQYGCTTDADCGSGSICKCGDPVGHCVAASCTSNADCKQGARCAEYAPFPGCDDIAFACQNEYDDCQTDDDCERGEQCTIRVLDDGTRTPRICSPPVCQF